MMYHRYHPRARKRIKEIASERAEEFDSTLVSNVIHDRVPEDEFLLQLADVVERLDDLTDRARATNSALEKPLKAARYDLTTADEQGISRDVVRDRAETVTAETIAGLEDDLDQWGDAWDAEAISEAKHEIQATAARFEDAGESNGGEDR